MTIYQSSHFGYEKFLSIGKLTYSTYLNLINFCFELIPKSKPIQMCTLKFGYHKFSYCLGSLTCIFLFTIISLSSFFFFITIFISLIFNSSYILLLNLSSCISSSFFLISASFFSRRSSRHPFNLSANS